MAYSNPSIAEFKLFFVRDFPYGTDPNTSVTDADIAKAFTITNSNGVNQCFFGDQASYATGYLYLSAHFMVLNLQSSSQGINGQFAWLEQSKSVGSVSQSFAIPQRILDNPEFAFYTKTNYGAMYLQMVLPQLSGNIYTVEGSTRP